MINAYKYIIENGGIDTEKSYPYTAHVSGCHVTSMLVIHCVLSLTHTHTYTQNEKTCRFKKADIGATMSSYVKIKKESESDLKVAVGTVGPISVAIDASKMSFQVRCLCG